MSDSGAMIQVLALWKTVQAGDLITSDQRAALIKELNSLAATTESLHTWSEKLHATLLGQNAEPITLSRLHVGLALLRVLRG